MEKILTVGIPAFHAIQTLPILLGSILTQTIKDEISIIIANDAPEDNDNYNFLKDSYPMLDINILSCEKNTGPGLARQRCLDNCKTDWITFIDADDVFMNPFSLENLINNITPNCIEVQGPFFQEVSEGKMNVLQKQSIVQSGGQLIPRMMPRNEIEHPWVFGRLYNVKFLKENKIKFSELRAMEDGEFNWKIRMLIEGTPLQINLVEDPIYLWKTGSDHSITRIGIEENDGEPLYNWDLCQVGATIASINAIKFCKKINPFNGGITRFTVEMMIGQYFTYVQCLEKKPLFAKQNWFNAKRFYNECYKEIENHIEKDILKNFYTQYNIKASQDMVGIIPQITFFDFMEQISNEEYKGKEEFIKIRQELPDWVINLDKKSGVLGDEDYIYVIDEKQR